MPRFLVKLLLWLALLLTTLLWFQYHIYDGSRRSHCCSSGLIGIIVLMGSWVVLSPTRERPPGSIPGIERHRWGAFLAVLLLAFAATWCTRRVIQHECLSPDGDYRAIIWTTPGPCLTTDEGQRVSLVPMRSGGDLVSAEALYWPHSRNPLQSTEWVESRHLRVLIRHPRPRFRLPSPRNQDGILIELVYPPR